MVKSLFVEDLFIEFSDLVGHSKINVQYQDLAPIQSFYSVLFTGSQLTQNQANFMIKLLTKYKLGAKAAGLNYLEDLEKLQWKNPFRVIDYSKKVFVEEGENQEIFICMKFPFALKEAFDKELGRDYGASEWDSVRKLRKLKFYKFNVLAVLEFSKRHEFEIDNSFLDVISSVEEIWQHQDEIRPHSVVVDGIAALVNANQDTLDWWLDNASGNLVDDLVLAKSMGYPLREDCSSNTELDNILKSPNSSFWFKQNKSIYDFYRHTTVGAIGVLVDRSSGSHEWVKQFVNNMILYGVNRDDIKVCFRTSSDGVDKDFNQWIKDNGLGGNVDSGRILIFNTKPPKWVFTKKIDVNLVVTNNMYPNTSNLAQNWIDSHPCVFYIGEVKPSPKRNKQIVEL